MGTTDTRVDCIDCRKPFIWTENEKDFMERLYEQGKINEVIAPKRCKECRDKRKQLFNKN